MNRLRYNLVQNELGANLTSGGTTITFASKLVAITGDVPTLTAGQYIPLTIGDPDLPTTCEVVWLTAYTTGATTGTISRAAEPKSGTAKAHSTGDPIFANGSANDIDQLEVERIRVDNGTGSAPSVAFTSETDSGFWYDTSGGTKKITGTVDTNHFVHFGTGTGLFSSTNNVEVQSNSGTVNILAGSSGSVNLFTNGSNRLSVTNSTIGVNVEPASTSRHARGIVAFYELASTSSQATAANLGPTTSYQHLSGRRYRASVSFHDYVTSGFPTWQINAIIAGAAIPRYIRWIPGTTGLDHNFQFFYTSTANGGFTAQINRITGAGNLEFVSYGGEPSITLAIEDVGPV